MAGGAVICQICMKECDEKIPSDDYDEDETGNDVAVEVSSSISIEAKVHKVKGVMCALCMREGKKLPIPRIELAKSVEDERRERLTRLASKHGVRSARDAFRLAEEEEIPADAELDKILGKREHKAARLGGDVLIVDEEEEDDEVELSLEDMSW